MRILLALIMMWTGFAPMSWAQDAQGTHALMTPEEQDIHLRAKKRLYPGGRDEDSLKVQSQLPQATRKMGPATEAPEEAEPGAETD